MKKSKMEKIEFRAFIKIRAKLGVSAQTITDELVNIVQLPNGLLNLRIERRVSKMIPVHGALEPRIQLRILSKCVPLLNCETHDI